MDFSGFISGGLAGAAGAVGDQAKGYIDDARKLDVAAELSRMEEEKANRLADTDVKRKYDAAVQNSDVNGQLYQNMAAGKDADSARAVDQADKITRNTNKAAQEDVISTGGNPQYLKALAAMTDAKTPGYIKAQAADAHKESVMRIAALQQQRELDSLQIAVSKMGPSDVTPAGLTREQALEQIKIAKTGNTNYDPQVSKALVENYTKQINRLSQLQGDASKSNDKEAVERYEEEIKAANLNLEYERGKLNKYEDPYGKNPAPAKPEVGAGRTPSPASIAALKASPDRAAEFDKVYGKGAAAKALGAKAAAGAAPGKTRDYRNDTPDYGAGIIESNLGM